MEHETRSSGKGYESQTEDRRHSGRVNFQQGGGVTAKKKVSPIELRIKHIEV